MGVAGIDRHTVVKTVHDGEVAHFEVAEVADEETEAVDNSIVAYTLESNRAVSVC